MIAFESGRLRLNASVILAVGGLCSMWHSSPEAVGPVISSDASCNTKRGLGQCQAFLAACTPA